MLGKVIIRNASLQDIDAIKKIADSDKKALGFIVRPIFEESAIQKELFIALINNQIIGFIRWHKRKDGWHTLYEMCIDKNYRGKGIGKSLFESIPRPKRGKCPIDNESNGFHKKMTGILVRTENGRKRMLNVYEWK